MINPQDLRIGNLIKWNDDEGKDCFYKVRELTEIMLSAECVSKEFAWFPSVWDISYDEAIPIPLTEEWLIKMTHLGEINKDGEKSFFNGDNILIRICDMSLFMHSEVDGSVFFVKRLKYLHEFQNIWYAIEGYDIEIKTTTTH